MKPRSTRELCGAEALARKMASLGNYGTIERQPPGSIRNRLAPRCRRDGARDDFAGVLTPDGKQLILSSNRSGAPNLYIKGVDSTEEKLLLGGTVSSFIESISPDGKVVLFDNSHRIPRMISIRFR